MKISKKVGIALFSLAGLLMAVLIIAHQNLGPGADPQEELIKKVLSCGMILASCIIFAKGYDKFTTLPIELYQSRFLIWKLAKNDFKKRYAGSYMGAIWAMIQPVVTVAMYYIVFDKIMGNTGRGTGDVPFVLFLTAGLVPWFYFSEALSNGTTALLEYNYLVKKVVFKISILPIIKIIAATFIHGFFVLFMLLLYMAHGFFPDAYTLQLLYYSFCLFIFVLGISYATCAVVIFFRDLTHMIAIVLQVGMWATPILWALDRVPQQYQILFKLNPMFYIVNGYRSAMLEKTWFWEDFYSTMFFWIITAVIFGIGALIFKRLKIHFADML